jgi:hypothetical protein
MIASRATEQLTDFRSKVRSLLRRDDKVGEALEVVVRLLLQVHRMLSRKGWDRLDLAITGRSTLIFCNKRLVD